MPPVEIRQASAIEERQPMHIRQRIGDFVVLAVDLANPVRGSFSQG
jgi:hypothetical protein